MSVAERAVQSARALVALVSLAALVAVIGCGTGPAPAKAPADTSADEAALKSEVETWMNAFNGGDADAVAAEYAEDALILPPGSAGLNGRAAMREFIAKEIEGAKSAGITFKNTGNTGVGVVGDLGWQSGTYAVVDASGKTVDTGKYMSLHRKVGGAWTLIRDTWNSDMGAAPAPVETPAAAPPA